MIEAARVSPDQYCSNIDEDSVPLDMDLKGNILNMAKHDKRIQGPSAVEQLADWALAYRSSDVPQAALKQAEMLLLDTLACGIAGLDDHVAHAVIETMDEIGGNPVCSIIGTAKKTGVTNAVLVNGLLIRVLDLNDYVIDAKGVIGGHPSDIIPVALAAGEFAGSSGRDVLAAIVLGYELYGRCKETMERGSPWDRVSMTGFIAPVMAGWLLKLDRDALAHAIALSVARAATSAVVRMGDISAAKSIASAWVAESGMFAAMMARHGVTGPLPVMEHRLGMKAVFPTFSGDAFASPVPADSFIMRAHIKAYPCVVTAQAAVAAAIDLHALTGGLDSIESLRVVMPDTPTVREHQGDKERADPKSRETADHSIHFVTAAAIADGTFGLPQFDEERWNDPSLRALMAKMEMATDPHLFQRAPGSFSCRLEATMKDGSRKQTEVLYAPGFSRDGLDTAAILSKFAALTPRHSSQFRQEVVAAVTGLDGSPTLAPLIKALSASA
jgi:2-methylcitrate dehydratase